MCVVSMVADHWRDRWYPVPVPVPQPVVYPQPVVQPAVITIWPKPSEISKKDFDKLRAEVHEMVKLLKRAKKYDEDHGEPDCEMDDKVAFLRKVAELVDVDLDEVFGSKV